MTNPNIISDSQIYTRVIVKPFTGEEMRVQYTKIDDVYVYFPPGKVIVTKEDINKF